MWRNSVPFSYTYYLPCSLWKRQDSTQRQLVPIRKFMRRAPAELFCAASLLHFRENTWRSPSTSRETPTVALSIAVSPPALSFHHRNRRYKFPIFLPFFSLSSSAPPPPSVLLEKVSGACFDRGDDLVEASRFTHCRLFQLSLLVPSLSFG